LENRQVYLSGQGADEIISDYSPFPGQSTFKGVFPDVLTIWENFYEGCQYSYLGKEEYVAGSHGIEARYPFLDREVVQEFLWLTPELKNKNYKAPLHEYLKRNNFPNTFGKKIGLNHLK
jgi:asparagine synthetase B (glutamine-hydrolysing)